MNKRLMLMLVTMAILQPVRSYNEETNAEAYEQPFAESYYDSKKQELYNNGEFHKECIIIIIIDQKPIYNYNYYYSGK